MRYVQSTGHAVVAHDRERQPSGTEPGILAVIELGIHELAKQHAAGSLKRNLDVLAGDRAVRRRFTRPNFVNTAAYKYYNGWREDFTLATKIVSVAVLAASRGEASLSLIA